MEYEKHKNKIWGGKYWLSSKISEPQNANLTITGPGSTHDLKEKLKDRSKVCVV